jgi:hypothetical protein
VAKTPVRRLIEKGIEAGADYIPDVIETPLRKAFSIDVPKPKARKPKASMAVTPKALPAPPKPLALPAPGPGLPPFAVKTKGGQWFVDKNIGGRKASDLGVKVVQMPGDDGRWIVMNDKTPMIFDREDEARAQAQSFVDQANPNRSPENAARRIADNSLRLARDASGPLSQLQDWFLRAAPRYIKNEMGTPDDPMRALAERGGLHIEMSPDEWSDTVSSVISRQPIGSALGIDQLYTPAGSDPRAGYDYGAALAVNMPWLKKAPVTDELYGIGDTYTLQDKMGMSHLLDEMRNAMDPRSGLPSELAVRPESLGRMGLAQAAERVGLINQFRAKEMERAALSNMDNPAVQIFKEYADDNPMGLRWTELRSPGNNAPLPEGWMPDGKAFYNDYTGESQLAHPSLQDALKYEGDTMGHCVGGYCDDVASGQSRIFSLRDAKGRPHVTIETRPGGERKALSEIPRDALDEITADAMAETNAVTGPMGISMDDPRWTRTYQTNLGLKQREWIASNPLPDEIVQIKGKQNAKPKDDYLPFVQDFVKSQNWANIGDMQNTGLVRLPDGRYITPQQAEEVISVIPETTEMVRAFASRDMVPMRRVYDPTGLDRLDPEEWRAISQYFEGYAIGGRVSADRCFSKGKSAVYAVNKSRK